MKKSITLDVNVSIVFGPAPSHGTVGTDTEVDPEKSPSTSYGDGFTVPKIDVGPCLILNPTVAPILVMLRREKRRNDSGQSI